MKKIVIMITLASLAGCADIQVNGVICDNIGVGSDPATQAGIPQECRTYNEKDAQKAFFKNKEDKKADVEDIIEFQKDEEKN